MRIALWIAPAKPANALMKYAWATNALWPARSISSVGPGVIVIAGKACAATVCRVVFALPAIRWSQANAVTVYAWEPQRARPVPVIETAANRANTATENTAVFETANAHRVRLAAMLISPKISLANAAVEPARISAVQRPVRPALEVALWALPAKKFAAPAAAVSSAIFASQRMVSTVREKGGNASL